MSLYRCAACGSPNVMLDTQSDGVSFSYGKGIAGTLILGPGGAVAGIESSMQAVYKCPDCGVTLTYPMGDEMKNLIDIGVSLYDMRSRLEFQGMKVSWNFLTEQYKNIEHGLGDKMLEEQKNRVMKRANVSLEAFNAACDCITDFKRRLQKKEPDRFSPDNPPSLAEYYSICSANNIFIENAQKYLDECFIAINNRKEYPYRGMKNPYREYRYFLAEYILQRYFQQNKYPCFDNNHDMVKIAEYVDDQLYDLIERWIHYEWHEASKRTALRYLGTIYNKRDTVKEQFGSHFVFQKLEGSSLYIKYYKLFPNSDRSGIIPRFIVKDGRLCYWKYSFSDHLHEEQFSALKNEYFNTYPEKKAEYEEILAEINRKSSCEKEVKRLTDDISKDESEIQSYSSQIEDLRKKFFGKKKNQEIINDLNEKIDIIRKQIAKKNAEIDELKKELKKELKDPNEAMDYFIVWHPVDETSKAFISSSQSEANVQDATNPNEFRSG